MCYGIQHVFPFWEDQLTNPNKLMFLKVHTSDITKEATVETTLSKDFIWNLLHILNCIQADWSWGAVGF